MTSSPRSTRNSSSTSSVTDSGNATVVSDEDGFELEDVYNFLKTKLQALTVSAQEKKDILENNVPSSPPAIEDSEWPLETTRWHAQCLLAQVMEELPSNWPQHRAHALFENDQGLSNEIDSMADIIQRSQKEIDANNMEISRMEKEIESLQTIVKERETKGEMKRDAELDTKLAIVKREFKKHRAWLMKMLEELFDDNEALRDTLSDLVNAFFSPEQDSYIDISEDGSFKPHIGLLLAAGIVIQHPYDKAKIRFSDFK